MVLWKNPPKPSITGVPEACGTQVHFLSLLFDPRFTWCLVFWGVLGWEGRRREGCESDQLNCLTHQKMQLIRSILILHSKPYKALPSAVWGVSLTGARKSIADLVPPSPAFRSCRLLGRVRQPDARTWRMCTRGFWETGEKLASSRDWRTLAVAVLAVGRSAIKSHRVALGSLMVHDLV